MIKLCNSSVITVSVNGTTKVFEPEEIQEKLIKSLLVAGIRDTWIAEDLALSVEYSLSELGANKIFTISEIDSFVVKILREVGLNEVADHYGTVQHAGLKTIHVKKEKISDTVSRYLGVEGPELFNTAEKVFKACSVLGLKEVFPSLILELAKHYHHEDFEAATRYLSIPSNSNAEEIWALMGEHITASLSEETVELVEARIISISGISKLFPSIRIEVNFANLATFFSLDSPVTELALIPYLDRLAVALDETVTVAQELYSASTEQDTSLPVYMKFSDVIRFSTEWLGGEWPDTSDCFGELITLLVEMLNFQVNVRNLPVT